MKMQFAFIWKKLWKVNSGQGHFSGMAIVVLSKLSTWLNRKMHILTSKEISPAVQGGSKDFTTDFIV